MLRSLGVVAVLAGSLLVAAPAQAAEGVRQGCDPIDPAACLVPYPNDWYTVPDRSTDTGRRLALRPEAMPRNLFGKGIDPAELNRSDGFSPGSPILMRVPGIDPARTGLAPSTDIGRSLDENAPFVIVNARTGERQPYWSELDAQDPQRRTLIVRPARRLENGTRYVVALRNARDRDGEAIAPGSAFAQLAENTPPADSDLTPRWKALQRTLSDLQKAGVGKDGLNLAWDFTTASTRSITGRALAMRDTAFRRLGAKAPKVLLTSAKDIDDPRIARRITGLVEVPSFLNPAGTALTYAKRDPGPYDPPVAPEWRTYHAPFQCNVPRTALTTPARPVLYGHGLFGDHTALDSESSKAFAAEHNVLLCATNWMGVSGPDRPYLALLFDLSNFGFIPDRMQQSYLNAMFLGRWMTHPEGAAAARAFRGAGGGSVIDGKAELTYWGVSHGGIQGAALTALSQDIETAVLSVPGMNFSTLLNRSASFADVAQVIDIPYPDRADQQLGFALLQTLWDRGEANGYVPHLTDDPLPGTPPHRVLLHEAFGDDAVANLTTEAEARTLGIPVRQPALRDGRSNDVTPFWGIRGISTFPYTGSALVMWDSGAPAPPPGNVPPAPERSPHDSTVSSAAARRQAAHFLRTGGEVVDVCGDGPCVAAP